MLIISTCFLNVTPLLLYTVCDFLFHFSAVPWTCTVGTAAAVSHCNPVRAVQYVLRFLFRTQSAKLLSDAPSFFWQRRKDEYVLEGLVYRLWHLVTFFCCLWFVSLACDLICCYHKWGHCFLPAQQEDNVIGRQSEIDWCNEHNSSRK